MMEFIRKLFPQKTSDTNGASEVKQYYEDWTQRYIESFGDTFQSRRVNDPSIFADYLIQSAGIKNGMRLVDAGCGIGGPAIHLCKKLDLHIDAITISEEQAKIAKQKVAEAGLNDRIKIICGDFQNMDALLPAESYDGIIFLESFVHCDDTLKTVSAAVKVTKPGGFIYIKDLYHGTARNVQEEKDIAQVIANANKYIKMNVKRLYEVVAAFETRPVEFDYIKKLGFESEIDFANDFIIRNQIPLNEGVSCDVFKLKFLDYYEMRLTKLHQL